MQSFILGELVIKLMPLYMAGFIKLDQLNKVYGETLSKGLQSLKIQDINNKF